MKPSILSIHVDGDVKNLITECAEALNVSVEEFVRLAVLEKIENVRDLMDWDEAKREYAADPVTLSMAGMEAQYL